MGSSAVRRTWILYSDPFFILARRHAKVFFKESAEI